MTDHPKTLLNFFSLSPASYERLDRVVERNAAGPAQAAKCKVKDAADVLKDDISDMLNNVLAIDFALIMARGWAPLGKVHDAAQLSRTGGGYSVKVGAHRLRSEHRPKLDVEYEGEVAGTFSVYAMVDLWIETAEIIVIGGAINALRNGRYFGAGELRVQKTRIVDVPKTEFTIPDTVRLPSPLSI